MITDQFVAADPLEDPRRARIEAARLTAIRLVPIEALCRESDTEKLLRRHAAEAPQPAGLTSETVIVLARRALPMLRAVAAPHFDEATRPIDRRHPVEAVAAEIHQPAAAR